MSKHNKILPLFWFAPSFCHFNSETLLWALFSEGKRHRRRVMLLRGTTEIFPSPTPSSTRVTGSTQPRCPAPPRTSSAPPLLRARRFPHHGFVTAAGMAKSRRPQEGRSPLPDPGRPHFTQRGTAFKLRERQGHPLGTSFAADQQAEDGRRAACASVRCRKYAGVHPTHGHALGICLSHERDSRGNANAAPRARSEPQTPKRILGLLQTQILQLCSAVWEERGTVQ